MKVSIITIHDPDINYGSTLQSCGTYNYVRKLGYDAQIIDYRPNYRTLKQNVKKALPKLLFFRDARQRRSKINDYFKNHARLTRKYATREDLFANPPESDVYITGSDVIWNRDVNPEGADPAFYLGFVRNGVKMSFSPSMGEIQPEENIRFILDQIGDFRWVSVREEKSRQQLVEGGRTDARCTMDPVFLHDRAYYAAQVHDNPYGDYTLIYLMSDTPEKREIVRQMSEKYGDKTVAFGGFKKKSTSDVFIRNAGVEDFLSLICHARHIITDSFHCISMSLIFNKQFVYLPSIDSSMRIENLLQYADLESRIITGDQKNRVGTVADSIIDYAEVNRKLQPKIEYTRRYLADALSACESGKENDR